MTRLVALALLLLAACGSDAPEAPSRSEVQEIARLEQVVHDDLEMLAMEEVEEAVAEDLPVRAAELLRAGALPAARRHAEAVGALALESERAKRLQTDAVSALETRAAALEQYATALERGLIEDLQLVEALEAQRQAETAIGALMDRLHAARESE